MIYSIANDQEILRQSERNVPPALHEHMAAYDNLKTLNTQIRDGRYKRELAFLHSVPVFSQLDK